MLEELKEKVFEANIRLKEEGLITLTWGNASQRDQNTGYVVIKPSGVPYDTMTAENMVIVDLEGHVVEGKLKPSSDLPTHLELYRAWPHVYGVVHTHSTYAAAFAQAEREIPCYGTTHADTFYGTVPCTRQMTDQEIREAYEQNTGFVILEAFKDIDPMAVPGVVVSKHGPFTWGKTAKDAVENAVVLEEVAKMAFITEKLEQEVLPANQTLQDKHYFRKHGEHAYYGQKK